MYALLVPAAYSARDSDNTLTCINFSGHREGLIRRRQPLVRPEGGDLPPLGSQFGRLTLIFTIIVEFPCPGSADPSPTHPRCQPESFALSTVDLTQDNFEAVIQKNAMVLVDFWAPWCGPCRAFAPVYEAASTEHTDVVFAKVNTEEQQGLGATFQIRSIPTLMLFREQIILFSQPGSLPGPALNEILAKAKALDMDLVRKEIAEQDSTA